MLNTNKTQNFYASFLLPGAIQKTNNGYEQVENSINAPLYKLESLAQGKYFKKNLSEKYGYSVYDFTDDNNLIEEPGLPPLSLTFLFPEKILQDLVYYEKLIGEIEQELSTPTNEKLASELQWWSIDGKSLEWIKKEVLELRNVCDFANANNYMIKFGVDY